MRRVRLLTVAACLAISGLARAEGPPAERIDLRVPRDPLPLVLKGGLVGGLAGAAVGGGVLGVLSATGHSQQDWGAVLATTAGVGVVIGVVWGLVGSASSPSPDLALRPAKDGQSYDEQHPHDLSHTVMLPVLARRF